MTMRPQEVLDVVANLGRPGTQGRLEARRRSNRGGTFGSSSTLTTAQRNFLDAAGRVPQATVSTYKHPAAIAAADPARKGRRDETSKSLSPSELAWLQRLPSDPAAVPFNDARRLFGIVGGGLAPDDHAFVRSIADPIREYHDRKQAEVDLANASTPLSPSPPEALGALADAIAAENDQLEPEEAVNRAANLLREHGSRRLAEQSLRIDAAQKRLDQLDAAAAQRIAVHR